MANLFCSSGGIVFVTTASGAVYAGQFLGLRHHCDDDNQKIQYLYIKLTSASGPYAIGAIVALNSNLVESVGPVTFE